MECNVHFSASSKAWIWSSFNSSPSSPPTCETTEVLRQDFSLLRIYHLVLIQLSLKLSLPFRIILVEMWSLVFWSTVKYFELKMGRGFFHSPLQDQAFSLPHLLPASLCWKPENWKIFCKLEWKWINDMRLLEDHLLLFWEELVLLVSNSILNIIHGPVVIS